MKKSRQLWLQIGVICISVLLAAAGIWRLQGPWAQDLSDLGTPFPSDFSTDQAQSSYTISTLEEFVNFAAASRNYSFPGATIHLTADIDWGGDDFGGIGSAAAPFCGTFDGHGFTIRNLYSTTTGLFQVIGSTEYPATIQNLTLDGVDISGGEGKAVLVCRFSGNPENVDANNRIDNVTVKNSTGRFSGSNCGLLVGRCTADSQAITISGCSVTDCDLICTASSATNLARWGMILGKDVSAGYSRIQNCTVSGCDIVTTDCNLSQAGLVLGASFNAITIDGCQVTGSSITTGLASATVTEQLGGIVGCLKSSVGIVSNCTVAQTAITTKGLSRYVGLMVGQLYGGTASGNAVSHSVIYADYADGINQAEHFGGLIGGISNSKATLEDCDVTRIRLEIADLASNVGGLVGSIADTAPGTTLIDCSAANSYITAADAPNVGGAIGASMGKLTAEDVRVSNVNIRSAGALENAGGFAGLLSGGDFSSLKDCAVRLSSIDSTAGGETPGCQIGGMIGCVSTAPAKLWKCRVENTALTMGTLAEALGGMVGSVEASAAGTVIADSTVSALTMESTCSVNALYSRYIGGMVGRASGYIHATNAVVEDSAVSLQSLVQAMGGFAGYISGDVPSVLSRCRVEAMDITETQSPLDDNYKCYHVSTFLGCVDSDSKVLGCAVSDSAVLLQGRVYYVGGLIGSTYSDTLLDSPLHGMVTVKNSAVANVSLTTKQSRNCNEVGGLVGWLSEGGMVTDCYVSGVTTPANTNATHVGGLIGYIPESTTDSVTCTVRNCYVEDCTLAGKNSLSATIGNAVATSEDFSNIYYYQISLTGAAESDASGATAVTAGLTDGTLVSALNTTSQAFWVQGDESPVLDSTFDGTTGVKVMTYNIYYLTQNDSYPITDRQNKVIDLIDSCAQDGVGVIGLQEVTKIWYDHISDYVKNQNTDYVWCGYGRYGGTFGGFAAGTNDDGDAFSLILYDTTKYSKVSEGHFWLSDTPDEKSLFYTVAFNYRVVNWVRLRDKITGEEFFFVNAHLEETKSTPVTNGWGYTLDASSGVTARIQQAQLICDRMAAVSEGLPVIILGDWNAYAGTDGYSTIIDSGYQDLREIAPDAHQWGGYNAWNRTDPSRFAKGDQIVASNGCIGLTCHVLYEADVDTTTGYHVSDHCPMVAEIRF